MPDDAVATLPRRSLAWRFARLKARRRREHLDRLLAQGAEPWTSSELMIRAGELTAPETRAKLANAIDGLVAVADHPGRVSHTVPYAKIYRSAVYRERDALLRLAERLRECTPVSVEAIALLATMLWHKDSPIYDRDRARIAVGNIVASCWDVLEPARPGHERRPQR